VLTVWYDTVWLETDGGIDLDATFEMAATDAGPCSLHGCCHRA
jgi:hypothetical protein